MSTKQNVTPNQTNGKPINPPLARCNRRQIALATARKAVSFLLYGEPDPCSFDRLDLKTAAVELGVALAEIEMAQ